MLKRILKWVGIVVAVLLVAAGVAWYSIFGNNKPIVDGPISPGVESVKDSFVSVFVLDVGVGKVAIVDCGNDKTGAAVIASLAKRNLKPDDVSAILLTHGHPDHTAACNVFGKAEVYAMDVEIPLIGAAAKVTHPIKDGDAFDIGTLHVEAFATPGHTDGSVVYFADGVLFFGDSAGSNKAGEFTKAVGFFSKDSPQNVASLKALETRLAPRGADVKQLAFAHSGPLSGFQPFATFAQQK